MGWVECRILVGDNCQGSWIMNEVMVYRVGCLRRIWSDEVVEHVKSQILCLVCALEHERLERKGAIVDADQNDVDVSPVL